MTPRRMNQILKGALIFLLIMSGVTLFFANKELSKIASDTARLRADEAVSEKQATAYQQTKNQVDALDYVTDLANKVLPPSEDQSAIVSELTTFANRSGLSVKQIDFKSDQSTPTPQTALTVPKGVAVVPVTIAFDTGAKYDNLLNFLQTLETNQRKSQVTNVALTPDSKDRSALSQVTIQLNLYSRSGSTKK